MSRYKSPAPYIFRESAQIPENKGGIPDPRLGALAKGSFCKFLYHLLRPMSGNISVRQFLQSISMLTPTPPRFKGCEIDVEIDLGRKLAFD